MAYHKADVKYMLDDRGYAGNLIHGQNPILVFEKAVRERIVESYYFKEQCWALNTATLCDRAAELTHIGGTYETTGKPTQFLCLAFKLVTLVPDKQIILEMLNFHDGAEGDAEEEDEVAETDQTKLGYFKYLRALAAFYIRLAWEPVEVYKTLEPLLADYRKLKRRRRDSFTMTTMDQFIDELLTGNRLLATPLRAMPKRDALEDADVLEPYQSALGDELDEIDRESQNEHDNGELSENGDDQREGESTSGGLARSPQADISLRS